MITSPDVVAESISNSANVKITPDPMAAPRLAYRTGVPTVASAVCVFATVATAVCVGSVRQTGVIAAPFVPTALARARATATPVAVVLKIPTSRIFGRTPAVPYRFGPRRVVGIAEARPAAAQRAIRVLSGREQRSHDEVG